MKNLKLFSIEEMSVLEALNVKGGIAEYAVTQNGCPNNVPGCACENKMLLDNQIVTR